MFSPLLEPHSFPKFVCLTSAHLSDFSSIVSSSEKNLPHLLVKPKQFIDDYLIPYIKVHIVSCSSLYHLFLIGSPIIHVYGIKKAKWEKEGGRNRDNFVCLHSELCKSALHSILTREIRDSGNRCHLHYLERNGILGKDSTRVN